MSCLSTTNIVLLVIIAGTFFIVGAIVGIKWG